MCDAKSRLSGRARRTRFPARLSIIAAAALAVAVPSDAFARGGFSGGGFRSAPSLGGSRGSGLSFSPRASSGRGAPAFGWGGATRPSATTPAAGGASSSIPRLSSPLGGLSTGSSAQRSLYDTARRSGNLFSSRTEAAQSFRQRYGGDFLTRFAAEPSLRPAYIPAYTAVGGNRLPVSWNAGLGGYGYLDPTLGRWVLYDALADAVVLDSLMGQRGYWWGAAPVYVSHSGGFLDFAGFMLALFIIVSIAGRFLRPRRRY